VYNLSDGWKDNHSSWTAFYSRMIFHFIVKVSLVQEILTKIQCMVWNSEESRLWYAFHRGKFHSCFLQTFSREWITASFKKMFFFNQDDECGYNTMERLHTCRQRGYKVIEWNYQGRWIGRRGPATWPPRSPDLTPLGLFNGLVWSLWCTVLASQKQGDSC
jgi:hypothetical protein